MAYYATVSPGIMGLKAAQGPLALPEGRRPIGRGHGKMERNDIIIMESQFYVEYVPKKSIGAL